MRRLILKILSCIILFLVVMPVFAETIQGGIFYTVDSAREYIQEGLPEDVNIPGEYYFLQSGKTQRVVYSRNNSGIVIGITVQYKSEPDRAYIYDSKSRLIYIDTYDKSVDIYPHRGYRYNLDGKLILTSLTVSKNEMFRFDSDGNLIVHSIDGVIYDENGKIIGSGK